MICNIAKNDIYFGDNSAKYADRELDINTREQKFSGKSHFVVVVRGTQIAFLEQYSYSLEDMGTYAHDSVISLTKPVDMTKGIENPNLNNINNQYRDLCDKAIGFPFSSEVPDNLPGTYYVFDLIRDADACQAYLHYISTNLPRIHHIDRAI
jgi:hypothetical protein